MVSPWGFTPALTIAFERIAARAHVGNLYVNRNQIGAVVGVHPFGGEGLSGTGPKAGGPHYLLGLTQSIGESAEDTSAHLVNLQPAPKTDAQTEILFAVNQAGETWRSTLSVEERRQLLNSAPVFADETSHIEPADRPVKTEYTLPGPTGEHNTLRLFARGVFLCIGGSAPSDLIVQIKRALLAGSAVIVAEPVDITALDPLETVFRVDTIPNGLITRVSLADALTYIDLDIDGIVADGPMRKKIGHLVAKRSGPILPILSRYDPIERFFHERTLTINTTAAGGNASLLALS